MENKAMYLSTYEERESGSMYEEAYDGHNLSKLNLCDEGKAALNMLTLNMDVDLHGYGSDVSRKTQG